MEMYTVWMETVLILFQSMTHSQIGENNNPNILKILFGLKDTKEYLNRLF